MKSKPSLIERIFRRFKNSELSAASGQLSGKGLNIDVLEPRVLFSAAPVEAPAGDEAAAETTHIAATPTTLASEDPAAIQVFRDSRRPSMSDDGTLVAMAVSPDPNLNQDIVVKNLQTGAVTNISNDAVGNQSNSSSDEPVISGDGTHVAFQSSLTNLFTGDANSGQDIFVKDLTSGDLMVASADALGNFGNSISVGPSISDDGRYVAFESRASNFVSGVVSTWNVYRKDLQTGAIELVSEALGGADGNGDSYGASISDDGRYVAFHSFASNLISGDANAERDVFVKDMQTGTVFLASADASGTIGNGRSYDASISDDGQTVAFHSGATNFSAADTSTALDIYVKNLQTGAITLASTDETGAIGNGGSYFPSISDDDRDHDLSNRYRK